MKKTESPFPLARSIAKESPIARMRRRGSLNVYELTAADELVRAFRVSIGLSAPRDLSLGAAQMPQYDASENNAVERLDFVQQYRQWRNDLDGSPELAAATAILFDEFSTRSAERSNRWRNGTASAYLIKALRHFATLRRNTPRGSHDWRYRRFR